MDIQSIIQVGAGIVATLTTTIIYAVKVHRCKTKNEKLKEINKYAQIVQKIPDMIKEAEASVGSKNGALKKTLVLQQIQLRCAEEGIAYNNNKFAEAIENILETPQKKEIVDRLIEVKEEPIIQQKEQPQWLKEQN